MCFTVRGGIVFNDITEYWIERERNVNDDHAVQQQYFSIFGIYILFRCHGCGQTSRDEKDSEVLSWTITCTCLLILCVNPF